MRRLDGTDAFPARLSEIVAEARKRQQAYQAAQLPAIEAAWADLQTRVIKERTLTGPRETKELLYITWLPDREPRSHFLPHDRHRWRVRDEYGRSHSGRSRPRWRPPAPTSSERPLGHHGRHRSGRWLRGDEQRQVRAHARPAAPDFDPSEIPAPTSPGRRAADPDSSDFQAW